VKAEQNKRLKREYKDSSRPLGVFLIRNATNNKVFLASGLDLNGTINRHRYQLSHGSHFNQQLQADWNDLGTDKFEFEIVEQLEPQRDSSFDSRKELEFMERMWLERLRPFGEHGYNQPRLSRSQKLRRIAGKSTD
jgi:hypothetical protein